MTTTTLDHLAEAQAVLKLVQGTTVRLRGQKYPARARSLIILDHIVSTPLGDYEAESDLVVIQVNCYAPSYEDALALDERARAALDSAGFLRQTTRSTPTADGDTLSVITTDYTR